MIHTPNGPTMTLKHLVTPAKYKHAKARSGRRWNGYESRGDRAKAMARIRRESGMVKR